MPTLVDVTSKLLLIDGHSMAFRAFYALPVDKFSTSGGQHTNAVYGFMSMMASLVGEEKPDSIAVAFDVGRKTFRTDMFPEYKAQRESAPEEFKGQVTIIRDILDKAGITTLSRENFEADDILATLATQASDMAGFDTLIVTGDRDYLQLVNDSTTVLYPMQGVSKLHRFTPAAVEEKYGLTPEQYPDYAALRGDSSDNLPGVPKVGEKTALKWILQYNDLDNLLDNADAIKGVVGENLRERIEQVRLNRTLTQMITDMDLEVGPQDLAFKPVEAATIAELFDELEFGVNLRERVVDAFPNIAGVVPESDSDVKVTVSEESLAKWLDGKNGVAVFITGDGRPGQGDATSISLVDSAFEGIHVELAELSRRTIRRWQRGWNRMQKSSCTKPKRRTTCFRVVASAWVASRTIPRLRPTCCVLDSEPMSSPMSISATCVRRWIPPASSCLCLMTPAESTPQQRLWNSPWS